MRAATRFARLAAAQLDGDVQSQVRLLAQVAVVGNTRYAESMPEALPWNQSLSQLQPTQVTTLDNGLRVATQPIPHSEISTVGVYIDAGSRYESEESNGVAHFLEHLIFKGTQKRTLHDIEVSVEDMGAQLNAYTSRESTAYFARCMGKSVPAVVDLLGDILLNSKLDASAIERERDVILREAKEIDGMPHEVCLDHLHATAFQHTPLGRTILGPAQNIKKITREDVQAYVRTHYTAGRMVLVATGDVEHSAVVEAATGTFAALPADSTSASDLIRAEPSHFTGSSVTVRDPDMSTTALAVAYQGASWLDADSVTLQIMQHMLGHWAKGGLAAYHPRSRLATLVASNNLADSVTAFSTNYHDTGLFGVYALTSDPHHLEDLSFAIMNEMTRLAYEVDPADVQLAKNAAKASLLTGLSSSTGLCEDIGRQLLVYGRIMPRIELFARIDAVTPDTVRECAGRVLQDQDMAVSAVGELSLLPHYNWFRRRTYWNRY